MICEIEHTDRSRGNCAWIWKRLCGLSGRLLTSYRSKGLLRLEVSGCSVKLQSRHGSRIKYLDSHITATILTCVSKEISKQLTLPRVLWLPPLISGQVLLDDKCGGHRNCWLRTTVVHFIPKVTSCLLFLSLCRRNTETPSHAGQ